MKQAHVMMALVVVGCSAVSISDRYGNEYGDWYNPGSGYRWQLDLCEHQIQTGTAGASLDRRLAMRCCMQAHGVPIADPHECRA